MWYFCSSNNHTCTISLLKRLFGSAAALGSVKRCTDNKLVSWFMARQIHINGAILPSSFCTVLGNTPNIATQERNHNQTTNELSKELSKYNVIKREHANL